MIRAFNSLQTKLTLSFVLIILVTAVTAFLTTLAETKAALKESAANELLAVVSVIATQLDGDALVALKPGDENTPQYKALSAQLSAMQQSSKDIKYVYTMRRALGDLEFIVDPEYGNSQDPGAAIGEKYEPDKAMIAGFFAPSVEDEVSSDKWGATFSAYAPVKNSRGEDVAMVGVDMAAEKLKERQNFISGTIYSVVGVCVIAAGLMILVFSRTLIRDLDKLNAAAEKISVGDLDVSINVNRTDEIGQLANSFGRMLASLKIMAAEQDNNKSNP